MINSNFHILLNIYTLAVGFTVGGVLASSFTLLTGNQLRFEMPAGQDKLVILVGTICRIIAGPFMIMRNTIRAVMVAGQEPYWIMMAIVIASLWSFCQGVIIVETVCMLGACS